MAAPQTFEPDIAALLEQLGRPDNQAVVSIGDTRIVLTDLDGKLWPGGGAVTKRAFLQYLVRVSPFLLQYLSDRPVSMSAPADDDEEHWLSLEEQDRPSFVRTVEVWSSTLDRLEPHVLVSDLATLLWLGELGAVELLSWPSRLGGPPSDHEDSDLDPVVRGHEASAGLAYPDFLVVNLDWRRTSGAESNDEVDRLAFRRLVDVALDLRTVAATLGTTAFVKTSGRRGLHCVVPLETRLNYSEVRIMAAMIGQFLLAVRPKSSTRTTALLAQSGFISIDHRQNSWGNVFIAPYSPRRHPAATISTPLTWEELPTAEPQQFTIDSVPDLLASRGDPWAELTLPRYERTLPCGDSVPGLACRGISAAR